MPSRDQEQGVVIVEREPEDLESDIRIHHRHELVARTITPCLERREHDAQILLEPLVRAEREPAHLRMQAIRADDEVELPAQTAVEGDANRGAVVLECADRVTEDQLCPAFERLVDHRGELRAHDTQVLLARFHDRGRLDGCDASPVAVDHHGVGEDVTPAAQLRHDAHALSHVEPGSPEVDQVAAGAQLGSVFDDRDLVTGPEQPVGEGRPGDPRSRNEHSHDAPFLERD